MTSIIVSPTQSGKTGYIQNLSCKNLENGKSVFIVLRNITADLIQFCKRWSYNLTLEYI
jgi:predicted AAA+ superfamily ATPase